MGVERTQGFCNSAPNSDDAFPRLGRATRSKVRREQTIEDGEPPPGSRGELGSTAPSVPLPLAHGPWRGIHAKCDHCFSSFAFRTRASVGLDVCFFRSRIDDPGFRKVRHALISTGIADPSYSTWHVRFSPIGKSAACLIVVRLGFGIYLFHGIISSHSIAQCGQTGCAAEARSIPRVAFSG